MDKEKVKNTMDDAGHKIDDWVEDTAEKHNYPKWKIWFGLVTVGLAAVGICRLIGWL